MADNPYGLRIATEADAEALLQFILPILEEDAAQTVSPRKVAALVARCVARDGAIAGIVSGEDGAIEASVGVTIDEFDYTEQAHAMVRWLGVAPAFRKTDRASRLVSYARWLFDTMGAMSETPIPLFMPIMTTAEMRAKVLLYQRRLPMVGVLHAFGCLPQRTFFNPGRVGKRDGGAGESPKGAGHAAPAPRPRAA